VPNEFGSNGGALNPPPALEEYQSKLLGWIQEGVEEGNDMIRAEPGYQKIDKAIQTIMGADRDLSRPDAVAPTTNRTGKIALDLASGLTDTKPFFEYRTYNQRYEKQGELSGKLAHAWWVNSMADQRFADGIKWNLAAGSAGMRLVYSREAGDLELQAYDPRDVLPVRPNDMLSYQSCMAVILRRWRSDNHLRALYPAKAAQIRPDRDGTFARMLPQGMAQRFKSALLGHAMSGSHQEMKSPGCDLYTVEVKDDSTNETGYTVLMGPHGKAGNPLQPWCYSVEPKKAMYPRGRVIEATKTAVLYDGPNPYWHGKFDIFKLTLDTWPWSWTGKAALHDLLPLQRQLDETFRAIGDKVNKWARPGVIADRNSIPRALMDKLDTRSAGMKLFHNPIAGKGVTLVEENLNDLGALLALIERLIAEMEFVSGATDVTNFAKLGQIPSGETVEKMMEAMSPAVRMRSRVMEAFLRDFAFAVLSNFMQFYDMPKRVRILGPQGQTLEDFDYVRDDLIPAYVHREDLDRLGNPTEAARARGPRPAHERAMEFLPMFGFYIAPGSLLSASEVTEQMKYLMLARMGVIDNITLLEKLGVQNIGAQGAPSTIMERLAWQQQQGIGINISPVGRKASAAETPRLVMKES
jgi:hypothetical protein